MKNNLEPAREEFCPASLTTPAPSPSGFSMDYDTMDYDRLLSHFDLEGDISKLSRKSRRKRGRITNGRIMKNTVSNSVTAKTDASSKSENVDATEEFGRVLRDEPTTNSVQAETNLSRQMKRLRKRIMA